MIEPLAYGALMPQKLSSKRYGAAAVLVVATVDLNKQLGRAVKDDRRQQLFLGFFGMPNRFSPTQKNKTNWNPIFESGKVLAETAIHSPAEEG